MAKKPHSWIGELTRLCRFDKVKLTFPDVHPIHRKNVEEAIAAAIVMLGKEYPGVRIIEPRFTVLEPSPNKPNGKYIVELQGVVAEAAVYLPAGWMEYVTYVDTKTFVTLPQEPGDDYMQQLLERPGGYRNMFIRFMKRGNRAGTKMPGKAFTLGSGKSGCHLNMYRRPAQPWGVEGKFRDEQVYDRTLTALDRFMNDGLSDREAWAELRMMCGRKMAETWAAELYARDLEPAEVMTPVPFTKWADEGGYSDGTI